jgi:hypothetical protein
MNPFHYIQAARRVVVVPQNAYQAGRAAALSHHARIVPTFLVDIVPNTLRWLAGFDSVAFQRGRHVQ